MNHLQASSQINIQRIDEDEEYEDDNDAISTSTTDVGATTSRKGGKTAKQANYSSDYGGLPVKRRLSHSAIERKRRERINDKVIDSMNENVP